MTKLSVLSILLVVTIGAANAKREDFMRKRDEVNKGGHSWKAELSPDLNYDDPEGLKKLCGTFIDTANLDKHENKEFKLAEEKKNKGRRLQTVPTSYDLRTVYPGCSSLKTIRDQAGCGSCWAVSTMTALSDRFCINKTLAGTPSQRNYSFQDILECCNSTNCGSGTAGCNGGYITSPHTYGKNTGVVTGDGFGGTGVCKPYFLRPGYSSSTTPSCKAVCSVSTYPIKYVNDRRKTNGYVSISRSTLTIPQIVLAAQRAIMARGSIIGAFTVYDDFYVYKSGVYQKGLNAVSQGGHAIRIIGWGNDALGGDYWIIANSWGISWGIAGYFWMKRGVNHCGIESSLLEGLV